MKRSVALAVGIGALIVLALASADRSSAPAQAAAPLDTAGNAAARPWKRYRDWPQRDEAKFNTLANGGLSPPVPTKPRKLDRAISGDAANGQKLVADRTRGGSCLA